MKMPTAISMPTHWDGGRFIRPEIWRLLLYARRFDGYKRKTSASQMSFFLCCDVTLENKFLQLLIVVSVDTAQKLPVSKEFWYYRINCSISIKSYKEATLLIIIFYYFGLFGFPPSNLIITWLIIIFKVLIYPFLLFECIKQLCILVSCLKFWPTMRIKDLYKVC